VLAAYEYTYMENRGHLFSHVWPFYERVVSNLDP
jgi:hypothetical protein